MHRRRARRAVTSALTSRGEAAPNGLKWCGRRPLREALDARVWSAGYAFVDGDPDQLLLDDAIGAHLARARDVASAASRLDGCFAAVIDRAQETVLVTDRYGSVPLYFRAPLARPAVASDDPWAVVATLSRPPALDAVAVLDMLRLGYVAGERTLIENVRTMPPASVTRVSDAHVVTEQYWRFSYIDGRDDPAMYEKRLDQCMDALAARIDALCDGQGREAVLMLSGGVDTRAVAALLATRSRSSVRCISYGPADDPDARTGREIADAVGFRFEHAPISVDAFNSQLCEPSSFKAAIREVGITTRFTCGTGARFSSVADDGVVLTGHTGFLSSALHRMNWGVYGKAGARRMTYARHYTYERSEVLVPRSVRVDYDALRYTSLDETLASYDPCVDPLGEMHRWNEEQRQRNLVLMEYRAYEQRAPWMMPLGAHDVVDLFLTLPYALRLDQRLYKQMVQQMCTGRAEPLAHISRVGGRLSADNRVYRRYRTIDRLQPASGAVLTRALPLAKRYGQRQRHTPPLRYGPNPLRHWFLTDGQFRTDVLDRVEAISVDVLRPEAIRAALLDGRSGEWVFQLLLAGALTVQGVADEATRVWQRER
ncbi:MAG: asparagine synthase (glutamine-hydrolyzing) [Actinomycetia bacterium]|nr:asparagine synthase (glutamine-hydrolyzing) [Actinomycetes bacterium]